MNGPADTLPEYDAWVFARLIVGHALNGELAAVSAGNRHLADRLAGLPPEGRRMVWDAHLEGLQHGETWIEAVAAIDPEAEAPEVDDGWGPLRLEELPPVQPFPVDVLPEPVQLLVLQGAEAIGCPVDFLAVPALAVAGGVIGRSASLQLKEGYFANGCSYVAAIGPPSDGKTPALKIVAAPIRSIDEALADEWAEAKAKYEIDIEAHESAKRGKGKTGEADINRPAEPARPVPRRIDIDDATMEVIPIILADNERGLTMIRDELTAFVLGMNQFKGGKGNDRSNALKIWSGDAIKKDRVGHEDHAPIRVPFPTLTVLGGLTPDMLGELADAKGRSDGFVDRFLMTYPDPRPVPEWSDRGLPPETAEDWANIVRRLWQRDMRIQEGRSCPHTVKFTATGKAAWVIAYNAHSREMNADDFPASLRGPWGKLREYAGRLTLILALLRQATDPEADRRAVPEIGPSDTENAWRLVAYFKSHIIRVRAAMRQKGGLGEDAGTILRWIGRNGFESFPQSELTRNFPRFRDDPKALDAALAKLQEAGCLRPRSEPPRPKGQRGRKPLPTFDVNPALHAPENCGNCEKSGAGDISSNFRNSPAPSEGGEEVDDEPLPF